ncbi:MAG: hypothetical protein AAGA10_17395 [Bacteroidota bacterium]
MKYIILLIICSLSTFLLYSQKVVELKRFSTPNATQAVAVDSFHFYSISNSQIVKYNKLTGVEAGRWEGPLKHLNSGIILNGKLYCANTNFPETPMASSIEIFDPKSLQHIGSHSFGMYIGSCTWLDRFDGNWYVMFVHYDKTGKERDMDASYTTLVKFDDQWRRLAGWTVPKKLVDHLRPMSISGGFLGSDGKIYASPHHFEEIYILSFPKMGYELTWDTTLEVPFLGQGIARDPIEKGILYGIHRKNREVIQVNLGEYGRNNQD